MIKNALTGPPSRKRLEKKVSINYFMMMKPALKMTCVEVWMIIIHRRVHQKMKTQIPMITIQENLESERPLDR